jgi:hypothetical protein
VPQAFREDAHLIGKSSYAVVYISTIFFAFFLGIAAFGLWDLRFRELNHQSNINIHTTIQFTCFLSIFYALQGLFRGLTASNYPPEHAALSYRLAVFLPWLGPILLCAIFLLLCERKLWRRDRQQLQQRSGNKPKGLATALQNWEKKSLPKN